MSPSYVFGNISISASAACHLISYDGIVILATLPLTINGINLIYELQVKFLGMVFDHRLTWSDHVVYVENKCATRLNLLSSITGQTWGGGKKVLLTLYRALVLSVIDYGCQALTSAPSYVKAKLTIIQNKALRICCGSMRSTANASIEIECGIMPLDLRREQLSLKYAVKINQQNNNPAKSILNQTHPNHNARNKYGEHIFSNMFAPTLALLTNNPDVERWNLTFINNI